MNADIHAGGFYVFGFLFVKKPSIACGLSDTEELECTWDQQTAAEIISAAARFV